MLYTLWPGRLLLMTRTAAPVTQRNTVTATPSPTTRLRSVTTTSWLSAAARLRVSRHCPPPHAPRAVSAPRQNAPPLAGAGLVQARRRSWVQLRLQEDQGAQAAQPPATTQRLRQCCSCSAPPPQPRPRPRGGGLVQVLVLVRVPGPHRPGQGLQEVQLVQPPSTATQRIETRG